MKRIVLSVNILLLLSAFYLGYGTYESVRMNIAAQIPKRSNHIEKKDTSRKNRTPSPADYQVVISRNLFQTQGKPGGLPVVPVTESLKPTELQIKLWGTVISDVDGTYAIIEDKGNKRQSLYRVGDTVQDATIKQILREKVVISVRGNDEVLEMERLEARKTAPSRASVPSRITPAPPAARQIRLKRSQLMDALAKGGDIGTQAKLRPHFTDGSQDGMILTGIKPGSIYRRMGLRNGDIILGIDESDIRSAEDVAAITQNINTASAISIQIKRRGRLTTMNYTIE